MGEQADGTEPSRGRSLDALGWVGAIGFGVAGDAVYDALKGEWGPGSVAAWLILSGLGSLVALLVLRSVAQYAWVQAAERRFREPRMAFLNTLAAAIVIGVLVGATVSFVAARLLSSSNDDRLWQLAGAVPPMRPYEVAIMASFFVFAVFFVHRQSDWVALAGLAFGFSGAAATVINLEDPEYQSWSFTLSSYPTVCLLLLVVALLVHVPVLRLGRALTAQR